VSARVPPETERVRRYYEKSARRYEIWIRVFERVLLGDARRRLCAEARGDVLEIAVGTGRDLPFYPDDVRLLGIDLSPAMLAIARRRALELRREIDLRHGDAQALALPDERFDTVLCALCLSTIPDPRGALREAWRVLRPGGRLLLLEHVRSPLVPMRLLQRMLDPLMVRWTGDHWLRDPLDHLEETGFTVDRCERTRSGLIELVVATKRS
jgi:ubiquinone/menaquinone biosynthesis C-methylase UbiE